MKKWKPLFLTALFMGLVAWVSVPGSAMAQDDSSDGTTTATTAQEDASVEKKVVVTAKSNRSIEDTAGSVSIITAEDIKLSGADNIKDVLMETAGVSLGVNGLSVSGRQNISIWGSDSDHVLILVDGKVVSGTDDYIGHSDFQYNWVPMDSIERIEVIKGPMSSIYGSQALGGVINIITKKSDKKFWGNVDAKYGNSSDNGGDLSRISLTMGGKVTEKLRLMASAESLDKDSARDEDDSTDTKIEGKEVSNGMAKVWFDIDETQSLNASYAKGEEERWKVDDVLYYDIDREAYSAGYKKDFGSVALTVDGDVTSSDSHYNSSNGFTHSLTNSSGKAELSVSALDKNYIVGGVQYQNQDYDKTYDLAASAGKNFSAEVDTLSGYLQDEIELGDFLVTLGGRYDDHEKFDGEFSPKVNALYRLGTHHRFKIGYGEGFKAPTVTQNSSAYSSAHGSSTFYGNDDLQPEESKTYQAGYEFYSDDVVFKTAVFKSDVSNLISSVTLASGDYQYSNVDEAEIKGLECELQWEINAFNQIKLGYVYLNTEDESTGEDLTFKPDHSFKARWTARLPRDVTLTLGAVYTGEQTDGDTEYDGFTTYKAQLSKEILAGVTLRVGMDNISDEDLNDSPYDISGRLCYVGINYRF